MHTFKFLFENDVFQVPQGKPICFKCDYFTLGFKSVMETAKNRHEAISEDVPRTSADEKSVEVSTKNANQLQQKHVSAEEKNTVKVRDSTRVEDSENDSYANIVKRTKYDSNEQFKFGDEILYLDTNENKLMPCLFLGSIGRGKFKVSDKEKGFMYLERKFLFSK